MYFIEIINTFIESVGLRVAASDASHTRHIAGVENQGQRDGSAVSTTSQLLWPGSGG